MINNRIGYTLSMTWRHRKALKAYGKEAEFQSESFLKCDPVLLKAQGIKVIALDLDGVLMSYGDIEPSKEIGSWLNFFVEVFGKGNIFVLTNKPTAQRKNYFANNFNGIELILSKRKKPYPDGLQQILQKTNIHPKALLMVDDRLLTGILAAIITKTSGCYITKPLVCLAKHPIQELFFITLRKMERFFL